jgi:hypothetical protein
MSQQEQPTNPPGAADVDAFAVDIALRLLPVCSTLAALCLAGLAYLDEVAPEAVRDTLADEGLFLAGFLFLTDIYLIIWTLRRGPTPRAQSRSGGEHLVRGRDDPHDRGQRLFLLCRQPG